MEQVSVLIGGHETGWSTGLFAQLNRAGSEARPLSMLFIAT